MKRSNDGWLVGDVGYLDVSTPRYPHAVVTFDAADWDAVFDIGSRSRWHALLTPTARTLYACRHVGRGAGSLLMLHRVLLGLDGPEPFVDHRNHDGLDNRRANLRLASRSENGRNKVGYGRTGYKGVTYRPRGPRPYVARIRVEGDLQQLGAFLTADAAARAYDAAARESFGEFAFLNFAGETAA